MTRRELARHLSKEIAARGLHYQEGSTVYQSLHGEWGAMPGIVKPPDHTAFYAFIGWDQRAPKNTILAVETQLKKVEIKRTGSGARVDRQSLKANISRSGQPRPGEKRN